MWGDMLSIAVRYSEAGWSVIADALEQPQVFASGAKAEAAAHERARQAVAAGEDAVVKIFARDGRLAGVTPYAASLVA
jgi:hypothetical protein